MYNHNLFYNEKYEIKGNKFDDLIHEWDIKYESLMLLEQKRFLMSIIENNNIKNVLEIGVFNGVSSLCMLKSGLLNKDDFNLYAIDINDNGEFVGQAVYGFCNKEELEHYHLNIGRTIFDIEEIIPKDIKFDLVFIDGGHSHPFPLFDLIFTIPYMHKDSIIILHDIIDYLYPNKWGPSFIFESWIADKYRLYNYDNNQYSTMGCIKLHNTKSELYNNIKMISNIDYRSNPFCINYYMDKIGYKEINDIYMQNSNFGIGFSILEIEKLRIYMEKYYTKEFANEIYNIFIFNYNKYLKNAILYINETRFFKYLYENSCSNMEKVNCLENVILELKQENNYLKLKLNNIIDIIAWWIPIKKLRDKFRNKLK